MERAVLPSMERVIASNVGAGHVGSFGLRDFTTAALSAEILPTFDILFGLPEPDLIPAAFSAERSCRAFW